MNSVHSIHNFLPPTHPYGNEDDDDDETLQAHATERNSPSRSLPDENGERAETSGAVGTDSTQIA